MTYQCQNPECRKRFEFPLGEFGAVYYCSVRCRTNHELRKKQDRRRANDPLDFSFIARFESE